MKHLIAGVLWGTLFMSGAIAQTQNGKVDTVLNGAATDRGVVITTGGTSQSLMAANQFRRGMQVQNQSTGDCYISGLGTATADYHSLRISAGALYESVPTHIGTGAISIVCTVTGANVYAREW
jgi:hypothetical protein